MLSLNLCPAVKGRGVFISRRSKNGKVQPEFRQRVDGGDVSQLRDLARQNTPTRVIGLKLGRTEGAVRNKASENDISLGPTNQSPYNRRK